MFNLANKNTVDRHKPECCCSCCFPQSLGFVNDENKRVDVGILGENGAISLKDVFLEIET